MKSIVSVRGCQEYRHEILSPQIEKLFSDCYENGICIKRGDSVLLKPNLLRPAGPDRAIVTHPMFVEIIAEILTDCGARLSIGDSPPLGNLQRALAKSGYEPFMKRLGIKSTPFLQKKTVEFGENRVYKKIDLAQEVFDFDKVLNLAKLKTHCQMTLTLAVKNLFGIVIGTDKASWHLRAGRMTDNFAHVLLQIYETVQPEWSLIDGILSMQGNGPNAGEPRHVGIICASRDAIALDSVVTYLVGFPTDSVRTTIIGEELGLGVSSSDRIEVLGDTLEGFPLSDFKAPKSMSMAWNLSYWNPVRRFMENHVITKPEIDSVVCQNCGICMRHCPPQAISEINGKMFINRKKCISCFCCHELCGSDAINIRQPYLGRLLSSFSK